MTFTLNKMITITKPLLGMPGRANLAHLCPQSVGLPLHLLSLTSLQLRDFDVHSGSAVGGQLALSSLPSLVACCVQCPGEPLGLLGQARHWAPCITVSMLDSVFQSSQKGVL